MALKMASVESGHNGGGGGDPDLSQFAEEVKTVLRLTSRRCVV